MAFSLSRTLGVGGDVGRGLDVVQNFSPAVAVANRTTPGLELLKKFGDSSSSGGGGIDYSGRPTQPGYASQLESPTYQSMRSQYASGSASPWANIATARQNELAEKQRQELAQRNVGQTAQSLDKLAAVGGLTSGARERTVQGGQQNYMTGAQDIGSTLGQNLMNIGISDAEAKQNLGKGLMTAELGDLSGRNAYNQNKYTADMAAWAAQQQANATRDAGRNSGGFLSSIFG